MGRSVRVELASVGLALVHGVGVVEVDLTDYQERCLIALVDLAREDRALGFPRSWWPLSGVRARYPIRVPTATRLARLGLIEFEPIIQFGTALMRVRATDAGIALCDSMGD